MPQYLLSVHSVDGEVREPMTDEEMQQSYREVGRLEAEMRSAGTWVFSGRLHQPDTATVVRVSNGAVVTTDGPLAESKGHLGGFYVIQAADLDAALGRASRVTACIPPAARHRPAAPQNAGTRAADRRGRARPTR